MRSHWGWIWKALALAIEVLSSPRTVAEKTDLMQRMDILPRGLGYSVSAGTLP